MNWVSLLSAAWRQRLHLRALVKKADLAQTRLTFIVNALRRLYADEEFLTLLRGEAMHTLPRPLAEQLELAEAVGGSERAMIRTPYLRRSEV